MTIDLTIGDPAMALLNGFFIILSFTAALFIRRIVNHSFLCILANAVAFLVGTLLVAKTQINLDDWFIYFADVLVIFVICLTVPINFFSKLCCALALVLADVYSLTLTSFADEIAAGVVLMQAAEYLPMESNKSVHLPFRGHVFLDPYSQSERRQAQREGATKRRLSVRPGKVPDSSPDPVGSAKGGRSCPRYCQ